VCFAHFGCFARAALLARIAETAKAKHATSTKPLVIWGWSVFKCSNTNAVFQTATVLILFAKNNKGPQASMTKPATAFSEIVYITGN